MISDIAKEVRDALVADGTLVAMLATYKAGPAIFTAPLAPEDAVMPYVLVDADDVANIDAGTKNTTGREIFKDVRCFADDNGSTVVIRNIADRILNLFHRAPFTVAGGKVMLVDVSGSIALDDEDSYGRAITLKVIVEDL